MSSVPSPTPLSFCASREEPRRLAVRPYTISVLGSLYSVSPPEYHDKSRSPPSPKGASGPSFGPAIKPSSDVECPVRTLPMFVLLSRPSPAQGLMPLPILFSLPQRLSLIAELPRRALPKLFRKGVQTSLRAWICAVYRERNGSKSTVSMIRTLRYKRFRDFRTVFCRQPAK